MIAISPDSPANLQPTVAKNEIGYQLVSDTNMEATMGFGLAYKVPAETLKQLNKYGIDLEKAAGKGHGLLPVPAVFLLDKDARVQFQYVNPDYRVRIPASLILEAARIY